MRGTLYGHPVFWLAAAAFALAAIALAGALGHVAVLWRGAPGALYRRAFADGRRERLFLASTAFFATFLIVRAITHAIHAGVGPFRNVSVGGTHIHHLVWGILLLLLVGYLWLIELGTGVPPGRRGASRTTAALYGLAAALTLDEFALWLRLEDVYWTPEGRLSVDAVILFGALLSVGIWGGAFLWGLARAITRGG
jgi:hypothetical protein